MRNIKIKTEKADTIKSTQDDKESLKSTDSLFN